MFTCSYAAKVVITRQFFDMAPFILSESFPGDTFTIFAFVVQEKDVEVIKDTLLYGYTNSFWTCSVSKLGYSGTAIISRVCITCLMLHAYNQQKQSTPWRPICLFCFTAFEPTSQNLYKKMERRNSQDMLPNLGIITLISLQSSALRMSPFLKHKSARDLL